MVAARYIGSVIRTAVQHIVIYRIVIRRVIIPVVAAQMVIGIKTGRSVSHGQTKPNVVAGNGGWQVTEIGNAKTANLESITIARAGKRPGKPSCAILTLSLERKV